MSILMVCTCGQEMITEDEHAGKMVRCPKCQGIIIVPGKRQAEVGLPVARQDYMPGEEDEEDYLPRRKVGSSKREGLNRARVGLALHWGKTLGFVVVWGLALLSSLALLMLTIAAAVSRAAGTPLDGRAALVVIGLLTLLGVMISLIMPVLSAVGSLLCFWLPERSRGRVLSMVACGLDAGAFFLVTLFLLLIFSTTGVGNRGKLTAAVVSFNLPTIAFYLACLLMLAGWILHMLVMNNLARFRRDYGAADEVMRMLVIGLIVLIAPAILIWVLTAALPVTLFCLLIESSLLTVWTGSLLGLSIKLLNLTSSVRHLL
jgi:hypothetical protein